MTTITEIETPVHDWRFWAARIATAIFIPIVLLGIAEVVLRIFAVGFDPSLTVPCTIQGKPGSCYNLFFPAPFFPPSGSIYHLLGQQRSSRALWGRHGINFIRHESAGNPGEYLLSFYSHRTVAHETRDAEA